VVVPLLQFEEVKIRLAEIDTPESRQPYGTRARQALSDLAFRRDVRVEVQEDTSKNLASAALS
jgi:endonuclease YncB( thermonuclease family)